MRQSLLAGVVLTATSVLTVVVSATFDLELESAALLGVALGAVMALIPDGSPGQRLAGFLAGFAFGFAGYVIRAAVMPDSSAGRAVVVGLVVAACALTAVVTAQRLRLWSLLLGAAAVAGGYEFTYAAAPPELADSAPATATSLLITVAAGYLAAAFVAPDDAASPRQPDPEPANDGNLDEMMRVTA